MRFAFVFCFLLFTSILAGWTQPAQAGEPLVELVDPGERKGRTKLRYKPKIGASETMVMHMDMQMSTSIDGQKVPMVRLPTMEMVMRMTTVRAKKGRITYTFEMADSDVIGPLAAGPVGDLMRTELAKGVGVKGEAQVSERGVALGTEWDFPEGMDPKMRQQMEQSAKFNGTQLPDEPVGVGARWTVTDDVESNGITVEQVTLVTLTRVKGSKIWLESTVLQTAPSQPMTEGLPPGVSATLDRLKSNGTATIELDLTKMSPVQSALSLNTTMESTMQMPGQPTTNAVVAEMVLGLEISAREPE